MLIMEKLKPILCIIISIVLVISFSCEGKKEQKKDENEDVVSTPSQKPFKKQPPPMKEGIIFQKLVGEITDIDNAVDVTETNNGGFMIAGYTYAEASRTSNEGPIRSDGYLLESNSEGKIIWEQVYGGIDEDRLYSLVRVPGEGYIAAGYTKSKGAGKRDIYVVKINKNKNTEWEKVFGGQEDEEANDIIETSDGNYLIAGITYSKGAGSGDAYFLKIDSKGNLIWEKTYGGPDRDLINYVELTKDKGFIASGQTGKTQDIYVIRLDAAGNMTWEKNFGGEYFDFGSSITQTKDGGYMLAGIIQTEQSKKTDMYLLKLNKAGEKEWDKIIGGKDMSGAKNVIEIAEGGYIVSGTTKNTENKRDNATIMKIDKKGEILWQETFGGNNVAYCNSLIQTSKGEYVFVGYIYTMVTAGDVDCNIYFVGYKRN